MTSDILSRIAEYKTRELAERRAGSSLAALEDSIAEVGPPRGFEAALRRNRTPGRPALIAEIKKASPSKGLIREDFNPANLARAYEAGGATCLSILTDGPSFQGSDEALIEARSATRLPCLRKDFMIDPWQITESRALGADAILVILALVDDSRARDLIAEAARWGMDSLIETHDLTEVQRACALGATLIGVNNRDLRSFVTDLTVTENLAQEIPLSALLITESGIDGPADAARLAKAGAAAMLVGESLMRKADVEQATRELLEGIRGSA